MKELLFYADFGNYLWFSDKGGVDIDYFDISKDLKKKIVNLVDSYRSSVDWDNPGAGCIFTDKEKVKFLKEEKEVFELLKNELEGDYHVKYSPANFI